MSEHFVDVTWRGLEIARKARLRVGTSPGGQPGGTGHVEHGTPMPIGTALIVTTAAGQTLGATVTAVREQIGGRTEPPGMDVAIVASGEAVAWWTARVEEAVAAAAAAAVAAAEEPPRARTRTSPPAELATAAAVAQAAPVVTAPVVAAVVEAPVAPAVEDARPTEVMVAVAAPDDDGPPTIETATLAAPTGEHAAQADAVPEELPDDSRRTTVMAAVDLDAIVAASADGAPSDDSSDAPGNGDKKKAARGKRRRPR